MGTTLRKKPPSLTPIADLLPKALGRWTSTPKAQLAILVEKWPLIVGTGLSVQTRPLRLNGDQLTIGVASSPLANELQLLQETLLGNLRREAPAIPVRQLRFHMMDNGTRS